MSDSHDFVAIGKQKFIKSASGRRVQAIFSVLCDSFDRLADPDFVRRAEIFLPRCSSGRVSGAAEIDRIDLLARRASGKGRAGEPACVSERQQTGIL